MAETPEPAFADFLQSFPLYKRARIKVGSHEGHAVIYFPKKILRYCDAPQCRREMEWETHTYNNETSLGVRESLNHGNTTRSYTCRHCGSRVVEFFLYRHSPSAGYVEIEKVGQRPRATPVLSAELSSGLGEQGRELYIKAVEARTQDMGIGALAYLRRVVEDSMNALIDHIATALEGSSDEATLRDALELARAEKNFTAKVAYAKAALPPRFFHAGHNPLERLHDWSSAGLHGLDDWECVEVFDEIRALFELLFERLARDAAERKVYEAKLIQLTRKR